VHTVFLKPEKIGHIQLVDFGFGKFLVVFLVVLVEVSVVEGKTRVLLESSLRLLFGSEQLDVMVSLGEILHQHEYLWLFHFEPSSGRP
jgi:hypothetical protein